MSSEGNLYSFDIFVRSLTSLHPDYILTVGHKRQAPVLGFQLWNFPFTIFRSPHEKSFRVTSCSFPYQFGKSCLFSYKHAARKCKHAPLYLALISGNAAGNDASSSGSKELEYYASTSIPLAQSSLTPVPSSDLDGDRTLAVLISDRFPLRDMFGRTLAVADVCIRVNALDDVLLPHIRKALVEKRVSVMREPPEESVSTSPRRPTLRFEETISREEATAEPVSTISAKEECVTPQQPPRQTNQATDISPTLVRLLHCKSEEEAKQFLKERIRDKKEKISGIVKGVITASEKPSQQPSIKENRRPEATSDHESPRRYFIPPPEHENDDENDYTAARKARDRDAPPPLYFYNPPASSSGGQHSSQKAAPREVVNVDYREPYGKAPEPLDDILERVVRCATTEVETEESIATPPKVVASSASEEPAVPAEDGKLDRLTNELHLLTEALHLMMKSGENPPPKAARVVIPSVSIAGARATSPGPSTARSGSARLRQSTPGGRDAVYTPRTVDRTADSARSSHVSLSVSEISNTLDSGRISEALSESHHDVVEQLAAASDKHSTPTTAASDFDAEEDKEGREVDDGDVEEQRDVHGRSGLLKPSDVMDVPKEAEESIPGSDGDSPVGSKSAGESGSDDLEEHSVGSSRDTDTVVATPVQESAAVPLSTESSLLSSSMNVSKLPDQTLNSTFSQETTTDVDVRHPSANASAEQLRDSEDTARVLYGAQEQSAVMEFSLQSMPPSSGQISAENPYVDVVSSAVESSLDAANATANQTLMLSADMNSTADREMSTDTVRREESVDADADADAYKDAIEEIIKSASPSGSSPQLSADGSPQPGDDDHDAVAEDIDEILSVSSDAGEDASADPVAEISEDISHGNEHGSSGSHASDPVIHEDIAEKTSDHSVGAVDEVSEDLSQHNGAESNGDIHEDISVEKSSDHVAESVDDDDYDDEGFESDEPSASIRESSSTIPVEKSMDSTW